MPRKSIAIFTILIVSATLATSAIPTVHAVPSTIFIRANGDVEPTGAGSIINSTDKATYTVYSDTDRPIQIERSNIILNGNGHVLTTSETSAIFVILQLVNVTITNITVRYVGNTEYFGISVGMNARKIAVCNCTVNNYYTGINLYRDTDCFIYNNCIIVPHNAFAISVEDCSNTNIAYNNITTNLGYGMYIASRDVLIFHNNFAGYAMSLEPESALGGWGVNITITRNSFLNNAYMTVSTADDTIYHNDFYGGGVTIDRPERNQTTYLDKGYPGCGNYWSIHNLTDQKVGKFQNETKPNGTGDNITDNNYIIVNPTAVDHYPFAVPYSKVLRNALNYSDVNDDSVVNLRDISAVIIAFGTKPGDSKWNWFADVNGDLKVDNTDLTWVQQNFNKRFP